jgi:hypothetical protein
LKLFLKPSRKGRIKSHTNSNMARRSETHDGKVTTGSAGCTGSLRGTITTFCRNLKHDHATLPNSKDADDSVVYAAETPPVFLDIKQRKTLRRRRASALDVLPTAATVIPSFVLEIASFLAPSPTPMAPPPRMKQSYAEDSVMGRRYKAAHDPSCRAPIGDATLGRVPGTRPLGSPSHE